MAVAGSTKWVADAVVATGGWLAASAGIFGTVENQVTAAALVAGLAGIVGALWKIAAGHSAMDKALSATDKVLSEALDSERRRADKAEARVDVLEARLDRRMAQGGPG